MRLCTRVTRADDTPTKRMLGLEWERPMKKLRLSAAIAVLVSVAACSGGETNVSDISNESLEANAMIYQEVSDNAANAEAEAMIANAGVAENATAGGVANQN